MRKSILTTIDDVAKALKGHCALRLVKNALLSDGWTVKQADQMILWAKQKNLRPPQPKQIINTVGETKER